MWVTEETPDRHRGGGSIRQANLLQIVGRVVPTDLLIAGRLEDDLARASIRRVFERAWEPPLSLRGWRRRFRDLHVVLGRRSISEVLGHRQTRRVLGRALDDIADDYDVVLVNHQSLIPLLPRRRRAMWLFHAHNVAAERARQAANFVPGRRWKFVMRREAANARRLERWAVRHYDALVVVSEDDAAAFALESTEQRPIIVSPNGVDTTEFRPTPLPRAPRVLLAASFGYLPNVDGARWLCEEVWPRVRGRVPDAELALVGASPDAAVQRLAATDGVALHADVPAIAPWYAWARVVAVPLRIGTGTRLKVAEAMATGRPIVGTTVGVEGYGLVDGLHARVVDDAHGFADALVRLLTDDDEANALARAAVELVEERYSWSRIGHDLARDLSGLLGTP